MGKENDAITDAVVGDEGETKVETSSKKSDKSSDNKAKKSSEKNDGEGEPLEPAEPTADNGDANATNKDDANGAQDDDGDAAAKPATQEQKDANQQLIDAFLNAPELGTGNCCTNVSIHYHYQENIQWLPQPQFFTFLKC